MSDFLAQFARDTIWCTPGQDKELIVKLGRISGTKTAINTLNFMKRDIDMPTPGVGYYVYQLGSYYQSNDLLQFYQQKWQIEKWNSFTNAVNYENVFVRLFVQRGFTFPLFKAYYMYTKEKALIIAIEDVSRKIPVNFLLEDVYIRFYQNAYLKSIRSLGLNLKLKTGGQVLTGPGDLTLIVNDIMLLAQNGGYIFMSVNGRSFLNIDPVDVKAGDILEWTFDPTVKRSEFIPLAQARTFISTLDSENKYLLHSTYNNYNTIEYYDDIDVDLFVSPRNGVYGGIWYPALSSRYMRMLTHRDYSIPYSVINTIKSNALNAWPTTGTSNLYLHLKFRWSGYQRPILDNRFRITDLYKLDHVKIQNLMDGTLTGFDEFKAANMEAGEYAATMSAINADAVTNPLAQGAFGYNGIAKNLFSNLVPIVNSTATVPDVLQDSFTAYEYDDAGQLLGFYYKTNQSVYSPSNTGCKTIEFVRYQGSAKPDVKMGDSAVPFTPGHSYRVYACPKNTGVPTYVWTDITGTNDYIVDQDASTISFLSPTDPRYLMVRSDSGWLARSQTEDYTDGIILFSIKEEIDRNQGDGLEDVNLQVPGNDFVLFMNGRSLVRNIDYTIDFPNVYVWNYAYLVQPANIRQQNFHYRVSGLGNSNQALDPLISSGLIKHGYLGDQTTYIPKNDKAVRITIDGKLVTPDSVKFYQDYPGVADPNNPNNGFVYQVQEVIVPMNDLLNTDWQTYRQQDKARDAALVSLMNSQYTLPSLATQTSFTPLNLICPFYSKIIFLILSNGFTNDVYDLDNTDAEIQAAINDYEWLLNFSPCNPVFNLINSNIVIRPHPRQAVVELNTDQFRFFNRVVTLKTPGVVTVSPYVRQV